MSYSQAFAEALAVVAREADPVGANDLRAWLCDAVQDASDGDCCYFCDYVGDSESGTVYYSCNGDLTGAPYTIDSTGGKIKILIDRNEEKDVLCRTTYEEEAGEDDMYPSMEAQGLYTRGPLPLCERNISKKERDAASSGSFAGKGTSFPILKAGDVKAAASSIGRAGPDNFSTDKIKANIIRIAKKKGWASQLPKAWQDGGDDAKEAADPKKAAQAMHDKAVKAGKQDQHDAAVKIGADCPDNCKMGENGDDDEKDADEALREAGARHSANDQKLIQQIHNKALKLGADPQMTAEDDKGNPVTPAFTGKKESAGAVSGAIALVESIGGWLNEIPLRESARTNYPIRIISPGTGTTAHYTPELLEREATKFKPGTLMFWNHPTAAEESARPEGDLNNLAAILTSEGRWNANGPKGPGIYAEAKVMADYADKVAERAPHIGLSIRAGGLQEGKKTVDGKPVLKEFTHIESVDYVTKAGRGGLALVEAAREAGILTGAQAQSQQQEQSMTEAEAKEFQALKESVAAERSERLKLNERMALQDAGGAISEYFSTVRVAEGVKERVTKRILEGSIPLTESKQLNREELKKLVERETNDELAYINRISGGRLVVGAGTASVTPPTPEQIKESGKARKTKLKESAALYGFGGKDHKVGRKILNEGRSAFDYTYNSRNDGKIPMGELASLPGAEA